MTTSRRRRRSSVAPSLVPSAQPVARLTSPAELVALLPVWLGYTPTESLVLVCCHEPRGRVGLTARVDLPRPEQASELLDHLELVVRRQRPTRLLVAVYTDEPDDAALARAALVDEVEERFADLVLTEAVLVRAERFWSYLCADPVCCPPEGRPVTTARESEPVSLVRSERVLSGRVELPDRAALERSLRGPELLAERAAVDRCLAAARAYDRAAVRDGRQEAAAVAWQQWQAVLQRWAEPPAVLAPEEAAALAVSLADLDLRDRLAATPRADAPTLVHLLEELCRRTPRPWDADVCALYGWVAYCEGGGAAVTIALERALASDPGHGLANLLQQALGSGIDPRTLRRLTHGPGGRR